MTFQSLVYLLCAITSLLCLILLTRGYLKSRVRLLFWSALCFVGLTLNNLFLFLDLVVLPDSVSLMPYRHMAIFAALATLLYGFIWETD